MKKNILPFLIILFFVIALFITLEFIWWKSDPIIDRSSDQLIQQGIVIVSMSLALFFIAQFFVPFYKRHVTKKLKNKLPDSKLLDDYTLELNHDNKASIFLTIDKTLFNKNKIEITCKDHDTALVKKLEENFHVENRNNQRFFVKEIIAENDKDIYRKYTDLIRVLE